MPSLPPKDAEQRAVFSTSRYLHIALDAALLIPVSSPMLETASRGFVTLNIKMDLHFP